MGLGIWEIILIIGVIMVFFGSRKLPALAKSIGEAKKEFKKSLAEDGIDVTESNRRGRIGNKNNDSKV